MHEIDSGLPLSPEQQATLDNRLPAPLLRIDLNGVLDQERLQQALLRLVERHEGLRMTLRPSPLYRGLRQQPVAADLGWHVLDLRTTADSLEARLAELCSQPFALDGGCLLRAVLIRLDEQVWQLALILAPWAGDRLSLETLFAELAQLYDQPASELEEVCQYAQFIDWRAELEVDAEAQAGRAYWTDLELQSLSAPRLAYRRPALTTADPAVLTRQIPLSLQAELEALAETNQQPLTTLLQAAWWALLMRISGQAAFVGGWQHDCRLDYEALAGCVGVFDKVLPLPVRCEPSEPFSRWLQQLVGQLDAHVGAQEYWPLVEPPQRAHLDVGFGLLRQPPACQAGGLVWRALQLPDLDAGFELALQLVIDDAGQLIALQLHHDTARYQRGDVQCLLNQYLCLLQHLPQELHSPLAELTLSDAEERRRQLSLCGPSHDFGQDSLPTRLAHWAATTPEAAALQALGLSLDYRSLNARVERLAARLQARGIGPDSRVALLLPRSGELVLALLAVLRAGAAYLPLDPAWPAGRMQRILSDAQPQLLLSDGTHAAMSEADYLSLASLEAEALDSTAPLPVIRLDQVAYLLYTSGTSGEAKGVLIEHSALRNYSAAVSEALCLDQCRRFALTSSVAADLGNTTLFGALWNGACLVVADEEQGKDAAAFARFIREQHIDCVKMVPSHLAALLEDDQPALPATLVLGGEATPRALVERIRRLAPGCRLHNHYGPTETTVGVLVHSLTSGEGDGDCLPLDRTLANTYAYVLEPSAQGLRLAALGAAGELYLGGAQLSRGYLNRSSDAFLDDPQRPGQRLYRSGDRARLLPDGRLLLLGRTDQQLKIRGFRVEPGELETALLALDGVSQAAVKVFDERLIGYVVGSREPESLLAELGEQLADYLQPTRLLRLAALPRLANGKIDRQALPAPSDQPHDLAARAPRDALEALLVDLYGELLERETLAIDDSLFDLGGHSLLVIKLCARLRKLLQIEVAPGLVFDHPSVAALAQALRAQEHTPGYLLQIAELRRQLAAMSPEQRAALQARARDAASTH